MFHYMNICPISRYTLFDMKPFVKNFFPEEMEITYEASALDETDEAAPNGQLLKYHHTLHHFRRD